MGVQESAEPRSGILTSSVRMDDELSDYFTSSQGLFQGAHHQGFLHVIGQFPTDDLKGVQVHPYGQIQETAV